MYVVCVYDKPQNKFIPVLDNGRMLKSKTWLEAQVTIGNLSVGRYRDEKTLLFAKWTKGDE